MSAEINRIAYINPHGQLATIKPDGRDSRVLAGQQHNFQFPAWSPDGAYLAAIGSDRIGGGIFVTTDQEDPGEPDILYYSASHLPIYFYWAPDSRRISFIANQPQGGIGLHLVSVAEKHSRLLATGQPLFWHWAPDGRQIFIHSGLNMPQARLNLIDLNQNNAGENIAQPGLFQTPGISSSSRFWAFAEMDVFDNGQLIIRDQQGRSQMAVPHEGAIAFSWSPSGDQLAFISPGYPVQRFYGPLQLVDPDAQRVQPLVEETVLAFFWAPNGRQIAYFTLVDVPGEDEVPTSVPASSGRSNGIYRSGNIRSQSGSSDLQFSLYLHLWSVEVATGRRQKLATFEPAPHFINQFLPFFDQYALSHRLWSPGSDALIIPASQGRTAQIIIIPADGGPAQPIAEGSMAFWSWQ